MVPGALGVSRRCWRTRLPAAAVLTRAAGRGQRSVAMRGDGVDPSQSGAVLPRARLRVVSRRAGELPFAEELRPDRGDRRTRARRRRGGRCASCGGSRRRRSACCYRPGLHVAVDGRTRTSITIAATRAGAAPSRGAGGWEPQIATYFNMLLLPPIALARACAAPGQGGGRRRHPGEPRRRALAADALEAR